jgi:hypothetical protein
MRAPPGVKDDESGTKSIWPEGKGILTHAGPRMSADTMREFPA